LLQFTENVVGCYLTSCMVDMHDNNSLVDGCLVLSLKLCLSGLFVDVERSCRWSADSVCCSLRSFPNLIWLEDENMAERATNGELRFLIKTIVDRMWAAVIVLDGLV
jgi:hypothetical protein